MSSHAHAFAVKMVDFVIEDHALDGLASEYYGAVYATAGTGPDLETIVEFDTEAHLRSFQSALESFRKPSG